jgi:hypothetical protein
LHCLPSKEIDVQKPTFASRSALTLALLCAIVGAAGCASTAPLPTADLAEAHTLVDQAEQSGAPQYAGEDLASARSKLQVADLDAQSRPEESIWLAREATADARVALARTNAAKAQIALNDVNAGTQTLRNEADRAQLNAPLPSAPAALPPQ